MNYSNTLKFCVLLVLLGGFLLQCEDTEVPDTEEPETIMLDSFPNFITANEDYYLTRIGSVPSIDAEDYRLIIDGAVAQPDTITLEALYDLPQIEVLLTLECIGNSENGDLLSTARWRGLNLGDLLENVGVKSSAEAVKVYCADGYFVSYTMDQIQNSTIIGALYMNGVLLPEDQGFPLRIIHPGYYGVEQPAWVTRLEVIEQAGEDFWSQYHWDTSPTIAIDSKIFFPDEGTSYAVGDTVKIGGTAYGGRRVLGIAVTTDEGENWIQADILKQEDLDYVWVFWQTQLILQSPGQYFIQSRAQDIDGNFQPEMDEDHYDGTNSWGGAHISVN